ncbi:HNH endonuclease [Paenibacillus sp. GCM10028914]|uniref:HNH endonuclease n=1 Tax=Paenibacillus sp. GCM10028914 TaxID=3273416 RepID=UPI00361FFDC1
METAVKPSGYGEVQLVAPFEIQTLHELTIERRVNEHARLKLTGTIPEEMKEACIESDISSNNILVSLRREGEDVRRLFCGEITELTVRHVRGVYRVELEALSLTSRMDIRKKNRSFQNTGMSYDELLDHIIREYPGADSITVAPEAGNLDQFTLQYRETDWEFMKRLASRFGTVLIPEATAESGPKFWFGVPEGNVCRLEEEPGFAAGRIWEQRGPDGGVLGDLDETPVSPYTVVSDRYVQLGDRIDFQDQELTVAGSTAVMDGGQIRFEYTLMPEEGIRQKPVYNTAITGASLEGRIIDVKQDTVRLHLDIDDSQAKDNAVWFPYSSVYTAEGNSGFYCMPQPGDAVQLYIPGFKEEKALAQGSVRKGGGSSPKTQDPNMKTWGTNHGKEMQMGPNHMSLIAKEGSLFINLDAGEGIQIVSDSTIMVMAQQDIELTAEKKLEITAEEAIYLLCKESSLILDGKADIQGTEVKLEGLIKGPVFVPDLPPVPEPEDPPPPQLPPPPEKKKGFWDKMLDGVQVALDVVGMIPGVGEIADLTNAAIYTARGDYTNAALSAAAAIPFAGWAATGAKFVNKGAKALKAGAKYGDEALSVAKTVQKTGDAAANTAKFAPSPGKVKTAARKIEEIKEQFSDIQKMKDTMKGMAIGFAVGASQEMVLNAGLEALSEVIDERYAMAIGMVLGLGGGGGKKRGGGSNNGIASGGGSSGGSGGSGGGKPRKDKDGKKKDTPTKDKDEKPKDKPLKDRDKDKDKGKDEKEREREDRDDREDKNKRERKEKEKLGSEGSKPSKEEFDKLVDKSMEDAADSLPPYTRKALEPKKFKKKTENDDGTVTYTLEKNGKEIKVTYDQKGNAIFNSKYDTSLPKKLYLAGDTEQFSYCSRDIYERAMKDPKLKERFTKEELELFKKGEKPDYYTWHHHQDSGRMQLVDYTEHLASHTGGRAYWGGGNKARSGKLKKEIIKELMEKML